MKNLFIYTAVLLCAASCNNEHQNKAEASPSAYLDPLPLKDTVVNNPDGSVTEYQVQSHAVYAETKKNGVANGPFKAFYKNGKIWSEDKRIDDRIEGTSYSYTPNGDTAEISVWKKSAMVTQIIFYSSHSSDPQKYYFVSKKGFTLYKDGKSALLDAMTPDSLIQEQGTCAYMWMKGKPVLFYGECMEAELIKTGEKPGLYFKQGDKRTFIRPVTEKEKKQK